MNAHIAKLAAAAAIAVAALTGCATQQGDPPFPSPDTATWPDGTYPNLANLAQVEPGVTKNQLYELLGPPHFHEWIFHVSTWNYLFHFRDGGKVATCQYQVRFDSDNRIVKTRWNSAECEAFGKKGAAREG